MKIKSLLAASAVIALAAAGCCRVSETTVIEGAVADGTETVYISNAEAGIDTVVTAVDGHFRAEIPTALTSFTSVECGSAEARLIADGTQLTVNFEEGTVTSDKARCSVQERFNSFVNLMDDFSQEYSEGAEEIYYDTELSEEEKAEKLDEYSETKISSLKDMLTAFIKKNKDNYAGVIAVQQVSMVADNDLETESYLDLLASSMAQTKEIVAMREKLAVREGTAEGNMFTDFAVNSVKGFDNNGEPVVEPACLSDYVGKGKYMLVDFWASWCGPCKAEVPNIIDVYDSFAGEKFDILSIAVWDEPEKTFAAADDLGIVWNQIVCTVEDRAIPTQTYGIDGIPQIILFGPDGTIIARDLRGEAIAQKVAEVLGY